MNLYLHLFTAKESVRAGCLQNGPGKRVMRRMMGRIIQIMRRKGGDLGQFRAVRGALGRDILDA